MHADYVAFMCFVWISEETAIIFVYRIKLMVIITETECVYRTVRAATLYLIQFELGL